MGFSFGHIKMFLIETFKKAYQLIKILKKCLTLSEGNYYSGSVLNTNLAVHDPYRLSLSKMH